MPMLMLPHDVPPLSADAAAAHAERFFAAVFRCRIAAEAEWLPPPGR